MAGRVDCLQAMACFAFLLLTVTVVYAQGTTRKEEGHLLAGGGDEQQEMRSPPSTSSTTTEAEEGRPRLVPVRSVVYRRLSSSVTLSSSFEPFRTCGVCRCCSSSPSPPSSSDKASSSSCVQTRCCYGIKCNLPGKPFGVCSFSPLTCGCGPNNDCGNSSDSPPHQPSSSSNSSSAAAHAPFSFQS